jgi:hypothetical protein
MLSQTGGEAEVQLTQAHDSRAGAHDQAGPGKPLESAARREELLLLPGFLDVSQRHRRLRRRPRVFVDFFWLQVNQVLAVPLEGPNSARS